MKNIQTFEEFLNESDTDRTMMIQKGTQDETVEVLRKAGLHVKLTKPYDYHGDYKIEFKTAQEANKGEKVLADHFGYNESQLNEGLSTTKFTPETVDKIWSVIKTLCESNSEETSFGDLTLSKSDNSTSEKWDFVAENSSKLEVGQISATTFSILVMITEGATVKGYFEIAPFDTLKQKFKSGGKTYISVVTDNDLSNPRVRGHKKIVYHS